MDVDAAALNSGLPANTAVMEWKPGDRFDITIVLGEAPKVVEPIRLFPSIRLAYDRLRPLPVRLHSR